MHWMNAGEVSYTTEDTRSLLEKRVCSLGCEMRGARERFWHPLLPGMWQILVKPPFHQNSQCTQRKGASSKGRCTPGCEREVPSDLEKFALGGGGIATLDTPNPFQQEFSPSKKRIRGSPSSLTEVQPLPGLGKFHLQSHTVFIHCVEHLSGHLKMATKFSWPNFVCASSLPYPGLGQSYQSYPCKSKDKGKRKSLTQ